MGTGYRFFRSGPSGRTIPCRGPGPTIASATLVEISCWSAASKAMPSGLSVRARMPGFSRN